MQVSKISNQPAFGIRCVNENSLNKNAFEILRNSKLAKEIDKKYSQASANYFFFENAKKEEASDIDNKLYTLLFDINLSKNKIWHMQVDTTISDTPAKFLKEKFDTLTLDALEESIRLKRTDSYIYKDIEKDVNKQNKIKLFLKKFFGLND